MPILAWSAAEKRCDGRPDQRIQTVRLDAGTMMGRNDIRSLIGVGGIQPPLVDMLYSTAIRWFR
jgi:hypothetical protein